MDLQMFTQYLAQYGAIAVFVVVFLEYLNLPGFPAGIIMPAAGVFAAQGELHFAWVLALSVAAGLLGSCLLYGVGRMGGTAFLSWFSQKLPRQAGIVQETTERVSTWGCPGVFVAKLIPTIRTVVSIPAGVIRMNFAGYVLSSMMGITLWNLAFIGAGYLFGEAVFSYVL